MDSRIDREKQSYNMGLQRKGLNNILQHSTKGPAYARRNERIGLLMNIGKDTDALEIGSRTWAGWIGGQAWPRRLVCINISETELGHGIELARNAERLDKIEFKMMDAHRMDFEDNSFSLVFGSGILHHLDFVKGINEIYRVVRGGGELFFLSH